SPVHAPPSHTPSTLSLHDALPISASPLSSAQLAAIVDLIGEGTISGKIAKELFEIVWTEGGDPRALVEARGMKQVTDLSAIEKRSEEHTSELQSRFDLVCRLLLEK